MNSERTYTYAHIQCIHTYTHSYNDFSYEVLNEANTRERINEARKKAGKSLFCTIFEHWYEWDAFNDYKVFIQSNLFLRNFLLCSYRKGNLSGTGTLEIFEA